MLAGGSAFGLAAADGVMRALAEHGRGFPTRGGPVPIVPAAAIFDLVEASGRAARARRGPRRDHDAARRGRASPFAARAGSAPVRVRPSASGAAPSTAVPGGLGSATGTGRRRRRRGARGGERGRRRHRRPTARSLAGSTAPAEARRRSRRSTPVRGEHTTLVVVATNAAVHEGRLPPARRERAPRHGRASIHPSHTRHDGDVAFALATGRWRRRRTSTGCGCSATEVMAEAVRVPRCRSSRIRRVRDRVDAADADVVARSPSSSATALACTKCPLSATRTQVVFGVGDPQRRPDVRGRRPGRAGGPQGEPFVGRAGQLLTSLIEGIGLTRADVYIANVVKCRPPGNRDPQPAEIESCRPYLDGAARADRPRGRRDARELRDQAPARDQGRHHEAARPGVPVRATAHDARSRRCTRRRCCAAAAPALAEARADFVHVKRALAGDGRDDARTRVTRDADRDARARASASARCCAPATWSCSPATSAPARRCSPRASRVALGVARAGDEPDVHGRARVRRAGRRVVHVDVYRLDHVQELHDLGFDDLLDGDVGRRVVEWGDRVGALLPVDRLEVRLEPGDGRRRPARSRSTPAGPVVGGSARDALARPSVRARCSDARARDRHRDAARCRSRSATTSASSRRSRSAAPTGGRPAPRRAARARRSSRCARRPACRARQRRRDRGRDRPGHVHRAAGRRHHRQGARPGAADPGGPDPEPRSGRVPAAASRPAPVVVGARRPAPRGVRASVPPGARRRATRVRLRGARRPPSWSPSSRSGGEELLLAGDGVGALPRRVRGARARRARRPRVRRAERRRAASSSRPRGSSARSSSRPARSSRCTCARATPRSTWERRG